MSTTTNHSSSVSQIWPPVEANRAGSSNRFLDWLGRTIPTMLVIGALAGLAYWGHASDWKVPKFSALTGQQDAEKQAWCDAHGVAEAQCVLCKPGLMPQEKSYGWCSTHGVHECPLEHPEIAQTSTTPRIGAGDLKRAQDALAFSDRAENNSKCKIHQRLIQLVSKEAAEKAGIEVAPVWEAPMEEAVVANGEVNYDQTRMAALSALLPGRVWRVEKEIGQTVHKDEVLALVDAADVGKAKTEFLQSLAQVELRTKTLERLRPLAGTSVAGKEIPEAEAAVRESQIRLVSAQQALLNLGLPIRAEEMRNLSPDQIAERIQFLGLPEAVVRTLDPKTTTANLLPVKSPLEGTVVNRKVVAGEVVDATKTLFQIADTRQVWLTLDVRLEEAKHLALGQVVRFLADGGRREVRGTIDWISTAVDEKTRTVKVRANLRNPDGQLRVGTFGTGHIVFRTEPNAVVVPNEAIQSEGDGNCQVVFVRDRDFLKEGAPTIFHVRTVRLGARDEKNTEIIAGVLPGELVVTKGSGALRIELLKNSLGDGCCGGH